MSAHEMNPDHPTLKAVQHQWMKIAALIMWKTRTAQVVLTEQDLEQFSCLPDVSMPTIIVDDTKDGLSVMLMPLDEAKRYAKKRGVDL